MIFFQAAIAESRGQVSPDRFEQTAAVDGKGIADRRCVVCHSCYDAPCQLRLSSKTGLERGASKVSVYKPSRLSDIEPTRLFIDETDISDWRGRGFFSVLDSGVDEHLINAMLHLKAEHPYTRKKLPATFPLDINRELSCPSPDEFDDYATRNPGGGMPYGMPGLSREEEKS